MTLIDPSSNSRSISAPNIHYHIVDNTTTLTDSALSALNEQLSRKIEENENSHKQELCELKNLVKENNRIIREQAQEIENLKQLITEKSHQVSESTETPHTEDNIFLDFRNNTSDLIYRTHGFQRSGDTWLAGEMEVMIEFRKNFPQKFTLDIKGHIPTGDIWRIEKGIFEAHIGKLDEKRHKQEFQLVKESWREHYTKDYATVLFETEDKDNNTIWIKLPHPPYNAKYKKEMEVGMKLYSLNIIPRK